MPDGQAAANGFQALASLDSNGDGLISEDEHAAALETMKEERQAAMADEDAQDETANLLATILAENAEKIEKYAQNSVTQVAASVIKVSV